LTPTAVSDLQDKGIPVGYVSPKEGPVLLLAGQSHQETCIPSTRAR